MPKSRNRILKKKKKTTKHPKPYEVIQRPFTYIENSTFANVSFNAKNKLYATLLKRHQKNMSPHIMN